MAESDIIKLLSALTPAERRGIFPNMDDEEFKNMLHMGEQGVMATLRTQLSPMKHSCNEKQHWFDKHICGLNKDGIAHLKELETSNPGHSVDHKLIRYLKQLKNMHLIAPAIFRSEINAKMFYQHLLEFCKDNDIPEEIVCRVVPALVSYMETGRLRPIIFVGEKGCGKTTAVRLLVEEALKLPTAVIKIPQMDGSHGMTGDCGSYVSADAGCIAKARLNANQMLVAYVFDEIDKAPHESNRANVEDELLSITDESCNNIYDNYLETTIVGLEHCPMFMTANDLTKISEPLADRCTIVRFPNADSKRIKSISRKYVEKKMNSSLYGLISFDYELMDAHIDNLVNHGITSLRKHQQMIDSVLENALNTALVQESDTRVFIDKDMFIAAESSVIGTVSRRMGFAG